MRSARTNPGLLVTWAAGLALAVLEPPRLHAANDSPALSPLRLFDRPAPARASTTPHPAVVRITADEGKAVASGSGSFVAARGQYGLVVTNWHVVRDASGTIEVLFPDGFRSSGTVLATDKDWDLAALLIWRPPVEPLKISNTAPQPGDILTIAGYGQGDYRAVTGKCTQYVSPSANHPFEIVELSAQARQGDSGGPILNDKGELAGVLFGAAHGATNGSYCGRVRWFLTSAWPDLDNSDVPSSPSTPLVAFQPPPPAEPAAVMPLPEDAIVPIADAGPVAPAEAPLDEIAESSSTASHGSHLIGANPPPPDLGTPSERSTTWETIAGPTRFEQAKTIFAILGVLAVWSHISRFVSRS